MANSDTLPAQESNAGGGNYREEVQYGIGHDGRAPQHRKFHCAYCKDNSKRCFSNWCESLRKLDFATRKQMLEANRDCEKCAGDCPKGACKQKFEKICGQGIKGRGCSKQHVWNELFCPTAKCLCLLQLSMLRAAALTRVLTKNLIHGEGARVRFYIK